MATLNGKNFQLYTYDTPDSINARISNVLNSVPRYIYVTPETLSSKGELDVIDFLGEIKKDSERRLDMTTLLAKRRDIITKLNLDLWEDVAKLWIAYNIPLQKTEGLSLQVESSLEGVFDTLTVSRYLKDKTAQATIRKNINDEIKAVEIVVKKQATLLKTFDKLDDTRTTPFVLNRTEFTFHLDVDKEFTLLEIFNRIVLNRSTPFATIGGFYKILKDFLPMTQWAMSLDESIILYTTEALNPDQIKVEDYQVALIFLDDEGRITVKIGLSSDGGNLKRSSFIKRFMKIFKRVKMVKDMKISSVTGVFNLPMQKLDNYIFSDLVMNNSMFSLFLGVNESAKATKDRNSLHVYFNHATTGRVTATITEKVMTFDDIPMRNEDPSIFPIGSTYVRFKVNANSDESIVFFTGVISRLFELYNNEKDDVVKFYKKYISFPVNTVKKLDTRVKNVKVIKSTKVCKYSPDIVVDSDEGMKFPRDDPNAKTYVCNNPEAPYPGLALSGKTYVPCCYANDQSQEEDSLFKKYYDGDSVEVKESSKKDEIKTNKFVKVRQFGVLPENITKTFNYAISSSHIRFMRKGVKRGKSSFLNCVLEAVRDTRDDAISLEEDESALEELLSKHRLEMATREACALCRQEGYDMSVQDIMDAVTNSDVYLDPKIFIRMVEEHYKCNIFIFTRDFFKGEMVVPRHTQAYYMTERSPRQTIFIYEHNGSKSNKALYPQCELIVRFNSNIDESVNTTYIFDPDSVVSKAIRSINNVISRSYSLDVPIVNSVIEFHDTKIIGQTIDTYGKTRRLDLKQSRTMFSIFTTPLQPFYAKEIKGSPYRINIKTALKVSKHMNMNVTSQTVIKGVAKELICILGNVNVVIPLQDSKPADGIKVNKTGILYPDDSVSFLEIFNKNKKIARYIQEYTFFVFSNYISDNDINEVNNGVLAAFADDNITINKKFIYETVGKSFSDINGVMDGGRIVATSEEMVRRLIYVLKLKWLRESDVLLGYKDREMLANYYIDVTDFDKIQSQVILDGDPSVFRWINESRVNYDISDVVKPSSVSPYFFRNSLVGERIYLAQNAPSLDEALGIVVGWNEHGYNKGLESEDVRGLGYTLYAYANKNAIESHWMKGDDHDYDIEIIAMMIDNQLFFVALMEI